MIRKGIAILILLVMIFSASNVFAADFLDLEYHWGKRNIENLFNKGVIAGYPDGTFKPENNVTRAEAIKMLIVATGEDVGSNKDGYWADNYIRQAISIGYVLEGEFDDYNKPMSRLELAKIIVRAIDEEYISNMNDYSKQLTDFDTINDNDKEYVLKAYVKGIITGYTDGTFKPRNNITRAEASTMLIRFLEPDKRIIPELKVEKPKEKVKTDFIEPEFVAEYTPPHWGHNRGYFYLDIGNREEYKESDDEYEMKIVCTSNKELNSYYGRDIFGDLSWIKYERSMWQKAEVGSWVLRESFFMKPDVKYEVSPDTVVELEITLKNITKGTEKVYNKTIKAIEKSDDWFKEHNKVYRKEL